MSYGTPFGIQINSMGAMKDLTVTVDYFKNGFPHFEIETVRVNLLLRPECSKNQSFIRRRKFQYLT